MGTRCRSGKSSIKACTRCKKHGGTELCPIGYVEQKNENMYGTGMRVALSLSNKLIDDETGLHCACLGEETTCNELGIQRRRILQLRPSENRPIHRLYREILRANGIHQ